MASGQACPTEIALAKDSCLPKSFSQASHNTMTDFLGGVGFYSFTQPRTILNDHLNLRTPRWSVKTSVETSVETVLQLDLSLCCLQWMTPEQVLRNLLLANFHLRVGFLGTHNSCTGTPILSPDSVLWVCGVGGIQTEIVHFVVSFLFVNMSRWDSRGQEACATHPSIHST